MSKLFTCPKCRRSTAMSYCPHCAPTKAADLRDPLLSQEEPETPVTGVHTPAAKKRGPGKLPHGGARPGAGRKTKPAEEHHLGVEFSLPHPILKLVDDLARQSAAKGGSGSRSAIVAEAVRELAKARGLL